MAPLAHILCVDDDPALRALLGACLAAPGRRVSVAAGTVDAMRIATATRPDLLLMDVQLADGVSGPAELPALRALPGLADMPVIFLTADPESVPAAVASHPATLGILTKPFNPMTLRPRVDEVWGRHVGSGGAHHAPG